MSDAHRIVVCPGSYDPITNGHVDVITRATALFDEVVVAVVSHSVRKAATLFSLAERLDFIGAATAHLEHVRAEPVDALVEGIVGREHRTSGGTREGGRLRRARRHRRGVGPGRSEAHRHRRGVGPGGGEAHRQCDRHDAEHKCRQPARHQDTTRMPFGTHVKTASSTSPM